MAHRYPTSHQYPPSDDRRPMPMPRQHVPVQHAPSNHDETHDQAAAVASLESIISICPKPPQMKDMAQAESATCLFLISPYQYNSTVPDRLPKSKYGGDSYKDFWDADHVQMPCSLRNVDVHQKLIWPYVCERLSRLREKCTHHAVSFGDLKDTIYKCAGYYCDIESLETLVNKGPSEQDYNDFMWKVLPAVCSLAIDVDKICGQAVPVLRTGSDISLTMSQLQAASLLACAFFCLFPSRSDRKQKNGYQHFQDPNFASLFGKGPPCKVEKLKCILHYFRRVTEIMPTGTISFRRYALPPKFYPDWSNSLAQLAPMHLTVDQKIEDIPGVLQVDFANKYIGGGVLGGGCVQEEIRFTICPEMLVSLLVCEVMADNECIFLIGCERYCSYRGYGDQFKFGGNYDDHSHRDNWGRKWSHLVAMDAIYFREPQAQYGMTFIDRELIKAYTSFRPRKTSTGTETRFGIATGNWGCGVFNGDKQLKAIIQLMAASEAQRPLIYAAFHDRNLSKSLPEVHSYLQRQRATVGDLYHYLIQYSRRHVEMPLFDFILQTPLVRSSKL